MRFPYCQVELLPSLCYPDCELFEHVKEGEARSGDVRLLILRGEEREAGQPACHCTCTIRPFTEDRNLSPLPQQCQG